MTCRHRPGDPECSSSPQGRQRDLAAQQKRHDEELKKLRESLPATPDSMAYEIEEVERCGPHVVLKVKYPNCAKCAYEGSKVMVFLNVTETTVLKWRKIDPHFRATAESLVERTREAPSPAARFPASEDGWRDAVTYARFKIPSGTR